MTTIEKIEALNKKCENSLGVQCYSCGWEVTSFRSGTPLELGRGLKITGDTIREAVSKAYKFVFESK